MVTVPWSSHWSNGFSLRERCVETFEPERWSTPRVAWTGRVGLDRVSVALFLNRPDPAPNRAIQHASVFDHAPEAPLAFMVLRRQH
jgi:hypothetical protein